MHIHSNFSLSLPRFHYFYSTINHMKYSFLLLTVLLSFSVSAQVLKKEKAVEVDPLLSDSLEGTWKPATLIGYDSVTRKYSVKLHDGTSLMIPAKDPEQWIRPVEDKLTVNKYGPGARFPYQKRAVAMKYSKCNPSENGIKKTLAAQMATYYKEYPSIFVDVTSFKGQNGYDDKKNPGQYIYPYKIEMLVHLKRSLRFGNRLYTEYQTWEYDREYAYATRPDKKCEVYPLQVFEPKLLSSRWYLEALY